MIPGLDILLGGVTGLIGNAFTTWFKYKNAKMKYTHEENMVKHETAAMIKEAEMHIQVTQSRIEGEIELADAAAYKESLKSADKHLFSEKWIDYLLKDRPGKLGAFTGFFSQMLASVVMLGFALVDWLNGFMRPAMTIYLMGSTTWLTFLSWNILEKVHGGAITVVTAEGIFAQVISTVIYLTVSAVTWWFGDRTMSKFLQEQGKKSGGSNGNGGMM
ncbi:MAG: hypothetical protein ACTSX1_07940 [Candidatus Heimdallarchaeaceae archaeon]